MEHVLFVIIYAAMLNNHKLLGLKLIFMFDDKDEKLTCLDVDQAYTAAQFYLHRRRLNFGNGLRFTDY